MFEAEEGPEQLMIQAAMRGDLHAFEVLVRRHQAAIRGYLAARLSCKNDAEDLAQEVFITAYRKRGSFSGEVAIESWFRGIARNLLKNHVRKFRASPIGGNEELQTFIDQGVQVEERDDEILEALRECVLELDGPSRDLVRQRYLEGLSVRELESKTGRGYSALTMQLHRIRCSLADCVESKLGFSPKPSTTE